MMRPERVTDIVVRMAISDIMSAIAEALDTPRVTATRYLVAIIGTIYSMIFVGPATRLTSNSVMGWR